MNPALRSLSLLLAFALLLLAAGCTGTRSAPATAENPLARFALAKEDIPFTVTTETAGTMQTLPADDPVSAFGPVRSYEVVYSEGTGNSPTQQRVRQVIYELPSVIKAEYAFFAVRHEIVLASDPDRTDARVVMGLPHRIGNQTSTYYIRYLGGSTEYPDNTVVFAKGNYLEIITLKSPRTDLDAVEALANPAAAWIPDGRTAGTRAPKP